MMFQIGDYVEVYKSTKFPEQNGLRGIVTEIRESENFPIFIKYDATSVQAYGHATNVYGRDDLRLVKPVEHPMPDTRDYLQTINNLVDTLPDLG